MMTEPCKYEKEIGGLIEAVDNQKSEQDQLRGDIGQLVLEIKQINQKWGERPNWGTLIVISTLTGLCSVLMALVGLGVSF